MEISRRGITLIDVLAILAIVVLGMAVVAAESKRSQESATRVTCASNLKQIGQAILLYQEKYKAWPRTRYDPATADRPTAWTRPDSTTPFAADGPAANDVTAAYRLLLATMDVEWNAFLCPSSPIADRDFAQNRFQREQANFTDERELSYSFANPYPNSAAEAAGYKLDSARITAEFAVAADINPAGSVTSVSPTASSKDTRPANSPNHDRDGQNVLYGDGHVEFQQSPFVGSGRDNIFTFGNAQPSRIVGSPMGKDDSLLLPTIDPGRWQWERFRTNAPWITALAVLALAVFFRLWRALRPARVSTDLFA